MSPVLQVGAFAPAVPAWLPAAAIFFGLQLLLVWYFDYAVGTTAAGRAGAVTGRERRVVVASLVVGYLLVTTAFVRRYASVGTLSMYLFFLAQTIEGAASLRFFKKVFDRLSGGGSGAGLASSIRSHLLPRVKYRLLTLFVVLVALSFAVRVLTAGPVVGGTWYDLGLVYTVASFLIAALGVSYRLRHTPDVLDDTGKAGVILCLAGAAVYDYQTLAGEFVAYAVGTVGYTVGFWVAALVIVGTATSPAVAVLRRLTPF